MQQACAFVQPGHPEIAARYLLHLPSGAAAAPAARWPLLFFLHGAAERGTNLRRVKRHGPPKFLDQQPDFPFIVVAPQCPPDVWWSREVLDALLTDVTARYPVDPDRVYGTGLSMGG